MKPNEVLTSQERDLLLRPSNLRAWLMVLRTWALTFGILWLVAAYPGVLTLLFAWLVLPGRQLSLAVLMHEAGMAVSLKHVLSISGSVSGCALPTLGDLHSYARATRRTISSRAVMTIRIYPTIRPTQFRATVCIENGVEIYSVRPD